LHEPDQGHLALLRHRRRPSSCHFARCRLPFVRTIGLARFQQPVTPDFSPRRKWRRERAPAAAARVGRQGAPPLAGQGPAGQGARRLARADDWRQGKGLRVPLFKPSVSDASSLALGPAWTAAPTANFSRGPTHMLSSSELLIELFSEEIPARMQPRAAEDLK